MKSKSDQLIASLCDSSIYKHKVKGITVIETHISWVLLTGTYVYKIKKPIKFSFIDFSTLEKRKFYCHEEIRLNTRLAPKLYIGVVSITGSDLNPSFQQSGDVIEYAVKMRQFPQHSLLSYLSAHNQLTQQIIDYIAREIADFHMRIENVPVNEELGTPEDIYHWVTDNFTQIEANLVNHGDFEVLKDINTWAEKEFHNRYTKLQQRRASGFIRECHGDMHLGNMVLIEDKVTIFDGIDFNKHLRWIDVISEVAFVTMDLSDRGHSEFSNRFINLYLQYTGDYAGLNIYKYYLVYRAMVRAKVALLRIAQKHLSQTDKKNIQKEFRSYIDLASRYISNQKIALIITHGLSGSGKSTYTQPLLESLAAIRIRSDVERKRLYGFEQTQDTQSKVNAGIYSSQSSKKTYKRLEELSRLILSVGYTVIVDACFLNQAQRHEFYILASDLKVPFIILEFQATEEVLRQRLLVRAKHRQEPSEADLEVLNYQLNTHKPLIEEEQEYTMIINTEEEVKINELVKAIDTRMHGLIG